MTENLPTNYQPSKPNLDQGGEETALAVVESRNLIARVANQYPVVAKVALAGLVTANVVSGGLALYFHGQASALTAKIARVSALAERKSVSSALANERVRGLEQQILEEKLMAKEVAKLKAEQDAKTQAMEEQLKTLYHGIEPHAR